MINDDLRERIEALTWNPELRDEVTGRVTPPRRKVHVRVKDLLEALAEPPTSGFGISQIVVSSELADDGEILVGVEGHRGMQLVEALGLLEFAKDTVIRDAMDGGA